MHMVKDRLRVIGPALVIVGMTLSGFAASASAGDVPGPLPLLNHYNVYFNSVPYGNPASLILRDQFGERGHLLLGLERYGIPVDKNNEGIPDPLTHLTWWRLADNTEEPPRRVVVQNQFGDQTLDVFDAEYLLAPALKNHFSGDELPISDHYKCYQVVGEDIFRDLVLQDQFGLKTNVDLSPVYLCNPVEKQHTDGTLYPIINKDGHLVCYKLFQPEDTAFSVFTLDQFGEWGLELLFRDLLCVPSLKDEVVQALEKSWGEVKSIYR